MTDDHPFPATVETDRLRLVGVTGDRVDPLGFYRSFWGAPDTTETFEHVPQAPHATPGDTVEWVETAAGRWAGGERATYAIRVSGEGGGADPAGENDAPDPTADGEAAPVGMAMLAPLWDRRTAIVGLLLHRRVWGRGYAGGVLDALGGVAVDRLDLDRVVVEHQPDNDASARAIGKFVDRRGGRREGRIRNRVPMEGWIDDLVRYGIPGDAFDGGRE